MIPGLNYLFAPDMQKILFFLVPALAALSIPGKFMMVLFAAISIYFFPKFMEVF